jgi:dolichol-phosphate mannosyltransferase
MPSSAPSFGSMSHRMLVVIPTYNESGNLDRLLKRIPEEEFLEILFIDDKSSDGTAEHIRRIAQIRKGIHLIERPSKLGLGTAYITGFQWALEREYDLIFEMDADLSHDPNSLSEFVRKIDEGADLVIGSRYLNGIRIINWPLRRLILSRFAASYTRFFTRLPLTDPTSGFKCFHKKVLKTLDLKKIRSNGYVFQIEMNYFAWKKGFRLVEIPIIFTDRHHGSSKMNHRIVREAILATPLLPFRFLFSRKSKT